MINKKIACAFAMLLACPVAGWSEDIQLKNQETDMRARLGEIRDDQAFHKLVDQSASVYAAVAKGPHGEVPAKVLRNARCIAVLPSVMTGALVVGGTHGTGLASCRDKSNSWSQPAPISMNQGSIGLQAGAKSADLVMFFQTEEAEKALKRGDFALGSDVSAVAGNYDSNVDTSTAGVVVFTRTEGLFAGASVNGSKIGKDQSELARYYGDKVDFTALLERRETPEVSGYTQKLTKLFPLQS